MAKKTDTKNTLQTPAPALASNIPLPRQGQETAHPAPDPAPDIVGRAKSDYGRIPLLPGVEAKRKITGKGEAVLTLEAFDWTSVPVEHVARSKAAVAVMRAAAALRVAEAAYLRAIAK